MKLLKLAAAILSLAVLSLSPAAVPAVRGHNPGSGANL